jgi:hypothetical protein
MGMTNKTEVKRIIIQNELLCKKCDDVIYSEHRHDFKYCKCGSVAVDGGTDYLRRVGNLSEVIERSMSMDADALRDCQEALHWAQDTERNDLGTVLAIIRVLRQHDLLDMNKF